MHFYSARRRKLEVPIIPLIDILTVLLIFFIVTTTFKEPKPSIQVDLPLASGAISSETAEQRSVLSVSPEGVVALDNVEVLPGLLDTYLETFVEANPGRRLEVKMDEKCPIGTMISVWEALTRAGFVIKDIPHRVRLADQDGEGTSPASE